MNWSRSGQEMEWQENGGEKKKDSSGQGISAISKLYHK